MKTLLALVILGAIAYFWHRGEITKINLELDAAREEATAATKALETAKAELTAAHDSNRALSESLAATTAELTALRAEQNSLLARQPPPQNPQTPAEISFDASPMTSFSYDGTRLIEARITSVSPAGVTITGKDGKSVVLDLEKALKFPDLRIRARDAIQAAIAER